jgi:hypothetical protein
MSVLGSSYKGAAGAVAVSRGMSPERFAERSEAYANKEKSDQQLAMLKGTRATQKDIENQAEVNSQKLEVALGELTKQKRQQNLQTTHEAFRRYDKDKFNVKHFNKLLADFEGRDAKLFNDIARVDRINTTDIPDMDRWGVSKAMQKEILENPDVKGSYVKITQKDGDTRFGNMDMLKNMAGGYNDYADEQEIARQTRVLTIQVLAATGLPTDKFSQQAFNDVRHDFPDSEFKTDKEFQEAYRARYDELRKSTRYQSDAQSNERRYINNKLAAEGIFEGDEEYLEAYAGLAREYKNLAATSKQKNLKSAEEAQNELAKMPFFNQKEGEPEVTRKDLTREEELNIESKVRMLEESGDQKLDAPTRKALMQIKELAHLGGKAADMTEDETGFWDNFIFRARKYFTDTTTGIESTSAFAEYSNLNRHALFGSVLPAAEITSHIQSFGSVGLQQGPILEHLRGSVEKLKNNYETLSLLNNPLVFEWRTGMTATALQHTIDKLERQLYEIDIVMGDVVPDNNVPLDTTEKEDGVITDPVRAARLDEVMGGASNEN